MIPSRHPRRAPRSSLALVAVAVMAVLVAGCGPTTSTALSASGLEPREDGWRGIPLEETPAFPDVRLENTDGDPIDLDEDFLGDPTLLFFGYTSCPDICPIHLAAIASAMDEVGISFDDMDVVFVSVDPARDDHERIREFLDHFDARMTGLRGDRATVAGALEHLDMPGPVVEGADPRGDGELIGHPAQVIGFDAQGDAQRMWPFGTRRSDWVADLPRVLEEW